MLFGLCPRHGELQTDDSDLFWIWISGPYLKSSFSSDANSKCDLTKKKRDCELRKRVFITSQWFYRKHDYILEATIVYQYIL